MKRKTFLLSALGAVFAAATGKAAGLIVPKQNSTDKAQIITGCKQVRTDGALTQGWGVQFKAADGDWAKLERYAIVLEPGNETRARLARKLRLLADAIESGERAVWGEATLTGAELNAEDYAAVDEAATEAAYPPDFKVPARDAVFNLHDEEIIAEHARVLREKIITA